MAMSDRLSAKAVNAQGTRDATQQLELDQSLIACVRAGLLAPVEELLKAGADPNAMKGESLKVAVKLGHVEIGERLMAHGAGLSAVIGKLGSMTRISGIELVLAANRASGTRPTKRQLGKALSVVVGKYGEYFAKGESTRVSALACSLLDDWNAPVDVDANGDASASHWPFILALAAFDHPALNEDVAAPPDLVALMGKILDLGGGVVFPGATYRFIMEYPNFPDRLRMRILSQIGARWRADDSQHDDKVQTVAGMLSALVNYANQPEKLVACMDALALPATTMKEIIAYVSENGALPSTAATIGAAWREIELRDTCSDMALPKATPGSRL